MTLPNAEPGDIVVTDEAVAEEQASAGGPTPREGKSPMQIAMERLRHDKIAMISLAVIFFFVLVGIFAPVLTAIVGVNAEPNQDLLDFNTNLGLFQSSREHPFGVEQGTGRDLFYMWAYGARPSLVIGIVASAMTVLVGVTIGLVAGFFGGWVDRVISWFIDVTLSLPFILMAIGIIPVVLLRFGGGDGIGYIDPGREATLRFIALIFVLVVFGWPTIARLVRGEVLSLREREFVQAARAMGTPTGRLIRREVLPNLLSPILVNLTILIPAYISAEATLSFLGVGLKEPMFSWGQTIFGATAFFQGYPIWLWVPALSISLLVLALSLFGDAVSDAFNPQTRR